MKYHNPLFRRIVLVALLFAVLLPSAQALETKRLFCSMNQAELFDYFAVLSSDPGWSGRAREFSNLKCFNGVMSNDPDCIGYSPSWDEIMGLITINQTAWNYDNFKYHLTIPEDIKLVSSGGYVLDDEVCAGESFSVQKAVNKGEWWFDGGDLGSPPINWTDDVRELVYSLVKTKYEKFRSGEEPYTLIPYRWLFNLSSDMQDVPNDETILGSREQQENLRKYVIELGYVKESDELLGADYSEKFTDSFCGIIVEKNGRELATLTSLQWSYSAGCNITYDYDYLNSSLDKTNSYNNVLIQFRGGQKIFLTLTITVDGGYQVYASGEDVVLNQNLVDPLTKMQLYRFDNWVGARYVDLAVACSLRENESSYNGMRKDGPGSYTINAKDSAEYKALYAVDCTLYVGGGAYGEIDKFPIYRYIQMPSSKLCVGSCLEDIEQQSFCDPIVDAIFNVGTIGINKSLNVVNPAQPKVEVSVAGADVIKLDESNALRVHVKNTGDVDVSIKSVYSKPEGKLISCDSDILAPGQQAECLLSVTPVQGQGLSIQVSYDYKSCGRSQVGLVTKTLIDSKTFRPVLKEQSYLMGVHGACDNSYYSCYSASEGSLFAGYKCFKTATGFYAPATERFNLRFDVSDIPKNAEILGAKLYLKASDIGGKQTISIYSANKIPEVVKCLPGGDICTKPYCGECKPLYDIDGTAASSAEISSTGSYSFELTNMLKEKINGDGIVSLQIRGAEGLWESQGQSSCLVENEWDKRDVSFEAGGRDGPYLDVVYK